MERLATIAAVRAWRAADAGSVGFVPTMGALHEGHLALVRRAAAESDRVIVSIFVNPLQFGPHEDFDQYPRDLESDARLLADLGVRAVFLPTGAMMYPEGFSTSVEVGGSMTEWLEGSNRPGHFRGVTTVVAKLMQIAQAERTYFGMKDAQQLLVLAKLVRDLAIPTTVVPVPTVREADGLALSSRNRYLTAEERSSAGAIPRGLEAGATLFAQGERRGDALRGAVREVLEGEAGLQTGYVACASIDTLEELDEVDEMALLAVAAQVGSTRLIDNRWLGLPDPSGLSEEALPRALRSCA